MYTFRINKFQSHTFPMTTSKEIKKKQVKAMTREELLNNKIVSPAKTVSGIAHLFKK